MTVEDTVDTDADVDAVIGGLQHDVGQFVADIVKHGQNRLHIAEDSDAPVYSENILEYMALAGWTPECTDTTTLLCSILLISEGGSNGVFERFFAGFAV